MFNYLVNCIGEDDPELSLLTGGTALSPQEVLEFGRQIAGRVDTQLRAGWCFALLSWYLLYFSWHIL